MRVIAESMATQWKVLILMMMMMSMITMLMTGDNGDDGNGNDDGGEIVEPEVETPFLIKEDLQ